MKLHIHIDSYIDKYSGFGLNTLKSLVESNSDVEGYVVHINSEGGSVTEGFAIHDYLKTLNNVETVIEGMCASIATVIALAAPQAKRSMFSNASIMIHNPYWTPDAPIGMEADDLEGLAADLRKNETMIADFYNNNLSLDKNVISEKMKAETWIYAAEALEMGFVGTVINDKVSARKLGTIKAQLNINTMQKEFTAEQKTWFETKFQQLSNLLKGSVKNMVVKLEDGGEVFVETEDGDLMGKKVVTVVDGEPTTEAAPNGEHATADGRIIVVADGIITEVKESEDTEASKELETVKAELENLKAELTAKENVIAEKETEIQARAKDITTFKAEFEAFKNKIVTGDIVNEQDFPKGGEQKKDLVTATLEYRKNKK
jgi:ATP-dependent protease ClpP protease subunit